MWGRLVFEAICYRCPCFALQQSLKPSCSRLSDIFLQVWVGKPSESDPSAWVSTPAERCPSLPAAATTAWDGGLLLGLERVSQGSRLDDLMFIMPSNTWMSWKEHDSENRAQNVLTIIVWVYNGAWWWCSQNINQFDCIACCQHVQWQTGGVHGHCFYHFPLQVWVWPNHECRCEQQPAPPVVLLWGPRHEVGGSLSLQHHQLWEVQQPV